MKITLISPYEGLQAIGLRILSSCLKNEGHDVQMLFLSRIFTQCFSDDVLMEIVEFCKDSELVGVSLMTNYFDNSVQVTKAFKKKYSAPVIWGGVHPTIRPEECLEYADIVCIGEGEEALLEFVRKMERCEDYKSIKNLWFNEKGNIVRNSVRPLIQNMDNVPFQDYNYESHFILHNGHVQRLNGELLRYYLNREYMTMATRGCPFGCAYCFNNTSNEMYKGQRLLRRRSISNVIQELVQIKEKLPFLDIFKFDDDNFFSYTKAEIEEFCNGYKEKVSKPLIITGVAPSTLTSEQLSSLIDAGLIGLRMGIQTASERTKRLYHRRHSNEIVEAAANIINKFSNIIRPQYDIIIDNPYENDNDLVQTLMFLSKLPVPYILSIYSLNFYPGTELYKKAKEDGIIKDDLNEVYRKYYHKCKDTYLNSLFFLLDKYARNDARIYPWIMKILTDKNVRAMRVNYIAYALLQLWATQFILKRSLFLLREAFKDIKRGDMFRIRRKIKKYFCRIRSMLILADK